MATTIFNCLFLNGRKITKKKNKKRKKKNVTSRNNFDFC